MEKLSRVLLSLILLSLLNHNPVHGGEVNPLFTDEIQFRWRNRNVILATTTSTQDSGLLDVLVPLFQQQSGYTVKTVAVGTGQALALAAKGDADVALVHAPSLEKEYVAKGALLNRRLVMYNDFVIIGPKEDPAKIRFRNRRSPLLKPLSMPRPALSPAAITPEPTFWKNHFGRRRGSSPKALGISSRDKAWVPRSLSPASATSTL